TSYRAAANLDRCWPATCSGHRRQGHRLAVWASCPAAPAARNPLPGPAAAVFVGARVLLSPTDPHARERTPPARGRRRGYRDTARGYTRWHGLADLRPGNSP